MKIELENTEKRLTLKDFEEIESKLGYALPERLKNFYLKYNGGSASEPLSIRIYHTIEVDSFFPFKYNKDFKNDPTYTAEGETLQLRKFGVISNNVLIFAMESVDDGRIAIDLTDGNIYLYPIIGMKGLVFELGKPQLIADSIDDFFDNLVIMDEQKQIPAIEDAQTGAEGIMPKLSDCSVVLTKEDIAAFEKELDVQLPGSMKNFYLKYNGGMPEPYLFLPQNEEMDFVEIKAFFPIKQCTDAFETIEVIAREAWNDNFLPRNLLPFAMDSGGNYYALNLKNKKIYYFVTDVWDDNLSREDNFKENTTYIAQSFKFFISHFEEEEE